MDVCSLQLQYFLCIETEPKLTIHCIKVTDNSYLQHSIFSVLHIAQLYADNDNALAFILSSNVVSVSQSQCVYGAFTSGF